MPVIAVLLIVLGVVLLTAAADDGDFLAWVLDDEGLLTISGTGEIPDFLYSPYSPWYGYRDQIKEVIIGDDITRIGTHSFLSCRNLERVTIGNSVTTMGSNIFLSCISLKEITIGNGMTPSSIEEYNQNVFFQCDYLENIYVSGDNTYYSSLNGVVYDKSQTAIVALPRGFSGEYVIPDGVTRIEDKAFHRADHLTSVVIPGSITYFGDSAFSSCRLLQKVVIQEGVTKYRGRTYTDRQLC